MATYYMHTLNGYPGFFCGYQICFHGGRARDNRLARTLRQIKQEQALSTKNRLDDGLDDDITYGYVIVSTP